MVSIDEVFKIVEDKDLSARLIGWLKYASRSYDENNNVLCEGGWGGSLNGFLIQTYKRGIVITYDWGDVKDVNGAKDALLGVIRNLGYSIVEDLKDKKIYLKKSKQKLE